MSLDNTKLQIKSMIGSPSEVDAAQSLIPIISEHHLLFGNASVVQCHSDGSIANLF